MIQADRDTAQLNIVGMILQWHVISRRLTGLNVTREEKHIVDNRRCQLALLARVLFHSEKQSIQKNMDDVLCFHGMFVAARFQL